MTIVFCAESGDCKAARMTNIFVVFEKSHLEQRADLVLLDQEAVMALPPPSRGKLTAASRD